MIRYRAERLQVVDHTPATALTAGTPVRLTDGRIGIPRVDLAAGELGAVAVVGLFEVPKASATVFAAGDEIWWDASASQAVGAHAAGLDADLDYRLGIAAAAAANGAAHVLMELNGTRADAIPQSLEFEFDVADGDTDVHVLLDPELNETGLLIEEIVAEVVEQMAGSSQDQGIVTIKNTAGSPATLATLTPSDAAADAVGDVVVGYLLHAASTGDALKKVAAGLGITGQVTQQTAGGTPAGKLRVRIKVRPLNA